MPSSTFSSDRCLPQVQWLWITGLSILLLFTAAGALEWALSELGYHPNSKDSSAKWIKERERASKLGDRALILVGASRILLGLDLDVLRSETGLEPVQLALDGSAGGPVLAGLANDPSIRGTVLVDYYDHAIGAKGGAAENMQHRYEESHGAYGYFLHPAAKIESQLTEWIKERLRAYADGANPMLSLRWRVIPGNKARQYLITLPDRSRLADYSKVIMPEFYLQRVARTLDEKLDPQLSTNKAELSQRISTISPMDNSAFLKEAQIVGHMVSTIQARGGHVIFVAMPSSGMVREIEERRYPRAFFWNRFINESGGIGVHSSYEPTLQNLICPDGSHLDMRDRARFTRKLLCVINQNGYKILPKDCRRE